MKQGYFIFFSIGLLAALCTCTAAQDETADDWFQKGRDLSRNGFFEEAIVAYDKAIELEPDNATFYTALVPNLNTLALFSNNQSKRNETLEAIDKALEIDPKNPIAWEQKGSMLYYQTKRYNESLEAYDKAIENIDSYKQDNQLSRNEFLSYVWTSKSISLWQLMRYNESLEAVDKAVQIDPAGNYDAWAFEGELLVYLGRYNESLQAFDGAVAIGTASFRPELEAFALIKKGYVLMQMGRYEEADLLYQKIIGLNLTGEGADRSLADAWHGRGNALAGMSKYNESLQAYDKAIELNAENAPCAWTGKADALKNCGRFDEAIESYDRSLELYPEYADAGIARAQKGKGDSLSRLGKQEDALAAYGSAVEASDEAISAFNNATPLDRAVSFTFDPYPVNVKFWQNRAAALQELGRGDESRQAYERALEEANKTLLQNPRNFNAYDTKAKILFELSRYDESIQVYDQFIGINPGPEASATALVWKGKLLFEMRRANESLKSLNQATETDPQSFEAWRWKAGILAELGRYEEALQAYNVALQLGGQPENADILLERSGVLKALGRQDETHETYAEIKENTVAYWIQRGNELVDNGSFEEALAEYDRAIQIDSENIDAWSRKAEILYLLEQQAYRIVLNLSEKKLASNPDDAQAWQARAVALLSLDRDEEANSSRNKALEIYDQEIQKHPDNATAWFYKAELTTNSTEALAAYDKVIELNGSMKIAALLTKGNILANLGKSDESMAAIDEAIQFDSNNSEAWKQKALTSYVLGNYSESLAAYEKVIELNPETASAWIWKGKGDALRALGRQAEANEAYVKARELGFVA